MAITLKQGDCLKLMKELPNESIDAVITDPPYFVLSDQEWDMQWSSLDEYLAWFDKVFAEMMRVLKKGGQLYVFFAQKYMSEYMQRYAPKRMLIWWHKNLSQPTNDMWLYQYDPIFYHIKGEKPNTFNGSFSLGYNSDVFLYPKPQTWEGKPRFHPAEKNLKSMIRIITVSTNVEDTVLDPFMGSGTTGVACVQLGRSFIGYEINPEYFKIADKRINEAKNQLKL
ncbi:MAG: site-specific DNA-methyltransferase [Thermoplasmata archaeon]